MIDIITISMAFLITILVLVIELNKAHAKAAAEWREERQQLLDRIQAPSYDHLKHHEVKVIKAQKEQPKETINLEVV